MATFRKRSGKWQVRVQRLGHSPLSKTFDTRGAAEKWARAVERELDLGSAGIKLKQAPVTFGALLVRYRIEVSPAKRGGAAEAIRLRALERRLVASCSLDRLTPQEIARYRDDRLKEVKPVTVNRDLDDISAVLNHARREWGYVLANPVRDVRRPEKGRGRERVLSADEEESLLGALGAQARDPEGRFLPATRNPYVKPLVELALATAMRRGELLSLRWECIDLHRQVASLPITKNGDSRQVPLSTAALQVLNELGPQETGKVFPVTAMALRKAFERAVERAELQNLHFHDLRHTATTRISALVPNVIELAAITGHRDLKMLARYYHPDPSSLARKLSISQ